MQLVLEYRLRDRDAWRTGLDSRAGARALAGVSLLQIWHDADDSSAHLCLFEVHDRPRAEEWLRTEIALHGGAGARFLRTA